MNFISKLTELEKQIDNLILYVASQPQNEKTENMRKEIGNLLDKKHMELDPYRFAEIQAGMANRHQIEKCNF